MTAKAVAMSLNCQGDSDRKPPINACGACRPCRQIISGNHPDVILIQPMGNYLRIDQIRKLLGDLAMKPFSAGHRVVIIADSQAMNTEAANALLKVLEEPPADTTLILTARQKSDLLATIVSRCRHIRFNRLSSNDLMACLGQNREVDAQDIETVAALADGSLSRAEALMSLKWRGRHDWLIRGAGLDRPGILEQRSTTMALAFAGQLAAQKEAIEDLLELMKTWIRDLAIWPYRPELVVHKNRKQQLGRVRDQMSDERLLVIWAAVEQAQKDIAAKANLRLTLDNMALNMIRAA